MSFPTLKIGDLTARLPIVQGGMGIRISLGNLAAAVAEQGGIGVIATAMIGIEDKEAIKDPAKADRNALAQEIQTAKEKTNGILGVNIMVALTNFATLVRTALTEKIDVMFVGAGLPLNLPSYLREAADKAQEEIKTKLVPIVSSARAAKLIAKKWLRNYDFLPDAVVLEGPKAGGHLGFKRNDLENENFALEKLMPDVIETMKSFEDKKGVAIPIITAGGIFTGEDIYKQFELGASGVQMGTRFVTTDECAAGSLFKEAYLKATEKDSVIIDSPVGMPGRAIYTPFLSEVNETKNRGIKCLYDCLITCDPETAPYCISLALINAKKNRFGHGFAFAGSNVGLVNKKTSVKNLIQDITEEFEAAKLAAENK